MLTLDTKLSLTEAAVKSPNLCDRFSDDDLAKLGTWVWTGYNQDRRSREAWERRNSAGMDLAMQVVKGKNFPWPNASNIAFPLVTIAALQYHARAYPALVSGTEIVQQRVVGPDPSGEKTERAHRISTHMSWQVLEQDQAWEEQHDRLQINVPIVGCAFKKSFFSSSAGHNVSELVLAQDLVMDYFAKSVESCQRKTHRIPLFRNEIYERVQRGVYRDVLGDAWYKGPAPVAQTTCDAARDKRTGTQPPATSDETTPFFGLEQHVNVDLDQDGYAEPYIITVEESSKKVLRIVTRFEWEMIERNSRGSLVSIRSMEYFTKYPFIPSPDGSVYDLGFGVLLGPLNESVNSLINQLVDAGTMSNSAGGFLGRGAKIRGGTYTFAPLEWKRVDSTADDLKSSIFPLPVREPSSVLFQLLSLLINYTNRIGGTTDPLVGENPGQNTTAEATKTMVEQGMKIFNGIFKRQWRAMKDEFKKLYILNGLFLPAKQHFGNKGAFALREDYLESPDTIVPVADPNVLSEGMKVQQALMVKQAAAMSPGYDRDEAERRWLRAMHVDSVEKLYKGTQGMPPPKDPRVQIEELRAKVAQEKLEVEKMQFVAELMEEQRLNNAKIVQLQAEATKMLADIQGDAEDRQINAVNAAIGVLKHHNDSLNNRITQIMDGIKLGKEVMDGTATGTGTEDQSGAGMGGMAGPPGNAAVSGGPAQMALGLDGAMG